MHDSTQVLICGAGPSGLLTGYLLASHGLDVTIIEASHSIDESPRAAVHHFPTFNAFKALGFLADFEADGFIGGHAGFHYPDHELTVKVPYEGVLVGQGAICRYLLARIEKLTNATVLWNASLVELDHQTDQVVAGIDVGGALNQIRCEWLVGADGSRSMTRKLCKIDFEGHTWPEQIYATNVNFDFSRIGLGDALFWCRPEFSGVVVRIDNKGNWRVAFKDSSTQRIEDEREHVLNCLTNFIPDGEAFSLDSFAKYTTHQRAATTMRQGRVLLIGDAAHITCPWGGLGLTTAFWDAFILGDLLPEIMADRIDETALDRYSKSRLDIFWNTTSAQATANRRLLQETDEQQRQQDMAQLQALPKIPEAKIEFEKTFLDIVGDPIIENSRWLDIR